MSEVSQKKTKITTITSETLFIYIELWDLEQQQNILIFLKCIAIEWILFETKKHTQSEYKADLTVSIAVDNFCAKKKEIIIFFAFRKTIKI